MYRNISILLVIFLFFQEIIYAQVNHKELFSSITIVVPYQNASLLVKTWANEENQIDFRTDSICAARCTAAFTATELSHYLKKTLTQTDISFSETRPVNGFFIELAIKKTGSKECSFSIEPLSGGILITGSGRTGLLYGGYEFLRMQGWRWYDLGEEGEIALPKQTGLILPEIKENFHPSMDLGRGFYMSTELKQSSNLLLWMARNRLNLISYGTATAPLANKLGMIFINGGHIFESILNPDRPMPSGKILWEEHRDWYGLKQNGKQEKDQAQAIQFCDSQPDLVRFCGDDLLKLLMGKWKEADLVNLWGFDTWGSTCECENCKKLGNNTDKSLHFFSAIRDYLNIARVEGRLDHDIRMVLCAYEGTGTMESPENPIPKNLVDAGDVVTFYPINRCYAHSFYEKNCQTNGTYRKDLTSWLSCRSTLGMIFGEYYNVSKYEDLPVLFTHTMRQDIPGHYNAGCRGIIYMHVPIVSWGPRTLTQNLYAQLAWDVTTNVDAYTDEYFTKRYGPFASKMKESYSKNEDAWQNISQWRNWYNSVLSQILKWDGRIPENELNTTEHMGTASHVIQCGRRSVELLKDALRLADECKMITGHDPYDKRISEDYRLLHYGLQTMELMSDMVAYYEALRLNNSALADKEWSDIHRLEKEMDAYWIPIGFKEDFSLIELDSKDALTRTQLKELIGRCKKYRIDNNLSLE